MSLSRSFPSAVILLAVITGQVARAQAPGDAVYVVTYIEAMPDSASRVAAALRWYRQATSRDEGNLRIEALRRQAPENHFALTGAWKDQASLDAHRKTAHAAALAEALRGAMLAPVDERVLKPLAVGPISKTAPGKASVYVLTHADALLPASRGVDTLTPLAEASRGESDNVRFEVVQQFSRLNHFTVIEVWQDARAHDSHSRASHTLEFREKFQAITGSLYDERLYRRLAD